MRHKVQLRSQVRRAVALAFAFLVLAPAAAGDLIHNYTDFQLAQQYFQYKVLGGGLQPVVGSGQATLSGQVLFGNVLVSDGNLFSASATKYIGWPLNHTYGVWNEFDFNAAGDLSFEYSLPIELSDTLPHYVRQGQKFQLDPSLGTGVGAALAGTHNMELSTRMYVAADAPWDGLDDVVLELVQGAESADLKLRAPTLPLVDSLDVTINDIPTPGEISYEGAYSKLGSYATLQSGGGITFDKTASNMFLAQTNGYLPDAWVSSADHFWLGGEIMSSVPYPPVTAAGLALKGLDQFGFDLRTDLQMAMHRVDSLYVELYRPPELYIPRNLSIGLHEEDVELSGTMFYKTYAISQWYYQPTFDVYFDMPGMDKTTLFEGDNLPTMLVQQMWAEPTYETARFTMTARGFNVEPAFSVEPIELPLSLFDAERILVRREPPAGNPISDDVSGVITNIEAEFVPEPGSFVLLSGGILGLALLKRRTRLTGGGR